MRISSSLRLLCAGLGVLCTIATAAAPGAFTIEQVMSAPFAESPIAAPEGSRVAWLLNEQGRRNIWVASGPEWKARKITAFTKDDGQEIAELAWAPNASYLLFSRGGDFETGRSENPNPDMSPTKPGQDIWTVGFDGTPARKLTEGHGAAISPKGDVVAFLRAGQIFTMKRSGEEVKSAVVVMGSARDLRWSPDGSSLAFVSNRRDHSFIGVYSVANKTLHYLDASVDRDEDPAWSPDGSRVAYVRIPAHTRAFAFGPERAGQPWSIRGADAKTGVGHQVFMATPGQGSVFHPIVAEDQLFWAADDQLVFSWEQSGWCHLYSVGAGGGTPVELTQGSGEVEHVELSRDRKTVFYSTNIGDIDRRHLASVTPGSNPAPKAITTGKDIEWAPAPTADGSALVFLTSSYNQQSHAAVQTARGIQALAPETVPAEFPAAALVRPQPVSITAADGMEIHGQVFMPATKAGRHPALIFFHGGSRRQMLLGFHYMGYYSNSYAMNQYLASQGYVVLSVNYRSGIGYGLNFREALNYGATGASEMNDVIGAGLYLKSRADVDPKRIGVWGGSYGGYLTAMALSRCPDLFSAGVDFHGVHDWNNVITNFQSTYDPRARGDEAKIAYESSPLSSIKGWKAPVLLIQGDDDRNVPFTETIRLAEALREQHVYFEELIFPNEIHDFLLHRDWVKAYEATADFFERKLDQAGGQ